MKATGMVRRVDELGRIVLPKELRVNTSMDVGQSVEIYVSDDSIILNKYHPGCIFCGEISETIEFKGRHICRECLKSIKEIERAS